MCWSREPGWLLSDFCNPASLNLLFFFFCLQISVSVENNLRTRENYSWKPENLSYLSKILQRQGLNRDYSSTQSSGQTLRVSDRILCIKNGKDVKYFEIKMKKKSILSNIT